MGNSNSKHYQNKDNTRIRITYIKKMRDKENINPMILEVSKP